MTAADDLHVVRLPLEAWNDACRLAARPEAPRTLLLAPPPAADVDWDGLVSAGLASERGKLDERWRSLIETYLDARIAFRFTSSFRDLAFEAVLAVAGPHVCVTERSKTAPGPDGTLTKVARDPMVEVAITGQHPWALARRVLPPLTVLRADAIQTRPDAGRPLELAPELRERALAAMAADPDLTASDALRREAGVPASVTEALQVSASASWLLTVAAGGGTGVGLASYAASVDQVYRARLGDDPGWEEVRPGDLAYSFEWHLLGALDAVAADERGAAS